MISLEGAKLGSLIDHTQHIGYRMCVRCVMDTSDPEITFDDQGLCNHCRDYDAYARPAIERARAPEGRRALERLVAEIKKKGEGQEYDCVIGISGGVDSTYVAWEVKRLGLRPLAVHFDSGWNSELAVNNIENIVKRLNLDLHTFVVDWEEMADLQLAFFKASLANCDIPTDHAFLAVLYRASANHSVKTIISGGNIATEFILPSSWGYNASDLRHLKAVHSRFGTRRLGDYPTLAFWARYFWYPFIRGIRSIRILDYMPYDKVAAKEIIQRELGWRDYGGKHYESVFTRFFQAYYLPVKFGYDKRRAHLSSLIVSRQMTKEQAIAELEQPTASAELLTRDKEFIAKKIGISVETFDTLVATKPRSFREFPSNEWLFKLKTRLFKVLRRVQ